MNLPDFSETEIIAVGDIVPEDFNPQVEFPDALTQLRTSLRERQCELKSDLLDKKRNNYFESYAEKNRKSYGLHDQYDALIHKHRYCSLSSFRIRIYFCRNGLSYFAPFYVVSMNEKPFVIISIGIHF